MEQSTKYTLKLKSLPEGKEDFDFQLDEKYFAQLESNVINSGCVRMQGTIERVGTVFTINMRFEGNIETVCDRCLAPLTVPVDTEARLIVKFGETYIEESDEIVIVPEQEGTIDLGWHIYEFILLSLPMQRMHETGECDPEMMAVINRYEANEATTDTQQTDPRWEALKQLKNKKDL